MPEGPEVLTIVEQLDFYFSSKILTEIDIENTVNKRFSSALSKLSIYLPLKLNSVRCKAKLIVFEFQNDKKEKLYFCNTLATTGRWGINYNKDVYKYIKTLFTFKNYYDNEIEYLFYDDKLSQGSFTLYDGINPSNSGINPSINGINTCKAEKDLLKRFKTKNKGFLISDCTIDKKIISIDEFSSISKYKEEIAVILMDQKKVCSGIGNYLLSEICYAAKINPWKKCHQLSKDEIKRLYTESIRILNLSYKHRGNSFSDYIDVNGDKGDFYKYLEVYNKDKTKTGDKVSSKKGPHGGTLWFVESQLS